MQNMVYFSNFHEEMLRTKLSLLAVPKPLLGRNANNDLFKYD